MAPGAKSAPQPPNKLSGAPSLLAAPSLPESAATRAHTCAVRAQGRAAEQEESAAKLTAGPVNWQLRGRLLAGARQRRGVRLPTPSSRPHSSGRKDGRCPALRVDGWGWGTRYSKAILCLEKRGQSAFSHPALRPSPPPAATAPGIPTGLLHPPRLAALS